MLTYMYIKGNSKIYSGKVCLQLKYSLNKYVFIALSLVLSIDSKMIKIFSPDGKFLLKIGVIDL